MDEVNKISDDEDYFLYLSMAECDLENKVDVKEKY